MKKLSLKKEKLKIPKKSQRKSLLQTRMINRRNPSPLKKPERLSSIPSSFKSGDFEGKIYINRYGHSIEADERYKAWLTGDIDIMLEYLDQKGDPIDTHFLYSSIVKQAYKNRQNKKMRMLFKKIASEHVKNFDTLLNPLLVEFENKLPQVPTFQYLATVYTEDKEYNNAIEVCENAINFGLDDGTKSGFEGRIERIKKKIL